MTTNKIIGLAIIIGGYGLIWFLLLKSKNIIEIINKKELKNLDEIEDELDLKVGDN
ncbi:hypothetical protein BX659_10458 [Orenia metallireducens]|uniref:Uncharacterized protein n=1 Tax=Orenia metallireducens TaxID=1413210 RepID=A0A285GBS2_9FIRM|nr:hypothetical protein [Orenia metallireducens]PRX32512.1 hypothetical protein BX659_10458 [Orenia metallireducens]SNY21030.1 hypothetical protein SAMN06265827_10690 [Orenia metallireducens]